MKHGIRLLICFELSKVVPLYVIDAFHALFARDSLWVWTPAPEAAAFFAFLLILGLGLKRPSRPVRLS